MQRCLWGCAAQSPAPLLPNSVPIGCYDAGEPHAQPLVPFGKQHPRSRGSAFGLALLSLFSFEILSVARAVHESACYPISDIEARWLKLACSYEFAERIVDSQAED
jgi:hypothetical protein